MGKVIVAQADVLHWAERQESLLDGVLIDVKVYTTNVDAANKRTW